MDISLARMVLARCKEDEQDRQYRNQRDEDPCMCSACRAHPRPSKILLCNCSGRQLELISIEPSKPKAIAQEGGFTSLLSYLPPDDIQIILDSLTLLTSNDQLEVRHLLGQNK